MPNRPVERLIHLQGSNAQANKERRFKTAPALTRNP
jgi:hypothetical protein